MFLDLVASDFFSNQHSAWFDRMGQSADSSLFDEISKSHPSFLFSEFNLFYNTERRLALADNQESYLDWFDSRIRLFRDVCLPSFESLIVRPTQWFLLCDAPQSSAEHALLSKLSTLSNSFLVAIADFRGDYSDHYRHYTLKPSLIRQCVAKYFPTCYSPEAIITSRLDTDDCLGPLYFYNLYKYLYLGDRFGSDAFRVDFIANFPVGAQVVKTVQSPSQSISGYAQGLIFGENCFTSRVEFNKSPETIRTVWSCPHDEVFGVLPVRNLVTQSPAWFQLIHGRNVQNTTYASDYSLASQSLPACIQSFLAR